MTMQAVTSWAFYVANGSQNAFAIPFRFLLGTDVEIYFDGTLQAGYALTGIGDASGGTATFPVMPTVGTAVFIRRATAQTQLLDFQAQGAFDAEAMELALDRLCAEMQDINEELSRRPALAVTTLNAYRSLLFPAPVASKLIGWNAAANALTLYDAAVTQVTVDPVSGMAYGKSTATVTSINLASVLTASALIPAGVRVLGVTYRCLVSFDTSNALASIALGGMGFLEGWGAALGITAGTVTGLGAFTRGDEPIAVSAENVTLSGNGGVFGATGSAKLTVHWLALSPDA